MRKGTKRRNKISVRRPLARPVTARLALPAKPYVFAEWKECRVALDYHVEIAKHYYSVPHQLPRETVWARITAHTFETFHRGQRIAAHSTSKALPEFVPRGY